jgi:hypothetical protein
MNYCFRFKRILYYHCLILEQYKINWNEIHFPRDNPFKTDCKNELSRMFPYIFGQIFNSLHNTGKSSVLIHLIIQTVIAKLSPSSSSSWAELVLISIQTPARKSSEIAGN